MAIDLRSISKIDLGALIAGGLAFLLSFVNSYVRASIDIGIMKTSSGTNAWDSYAVLGILLIIAATALIAVRVFAGHVLPAGVPWNLIALVASALGTILLILRAFTYGGSSGAEGFGVSVGPGWSGWLLFIACIALTVLTALMFKSSGEKLPDFKAGGTTPPPAA